MTEPANDDGGGSAVLERHLLWLWLLGTMVAIGLLVAAVNQNQLVRGSVYVVAAATGGMISVFAVIRLVAQRDTELRTSTRLAVVSATGIGVGIAIASYGYRREAEGATGVGVLVAIYAFAFWSDWFNQRIRPGGDATKQTITVAFATTLIGASLLFLAFTDTFGALTGTAVLAFVLGLVVLKGSIVQFAEAGGAGATLRLAAVWGVTVLNVLASIGLLAFAGRPGLVLGGGLLVGSLSVLGLLLHNAVPLPFGGAGDTTVAATVQMSSGGRDAVFGIRPVIGLGALAVLAGFFTTSSLIDSWLAVVFIVMVFVVIGAFFVLPGETVFALIVFGFMVVWVAHDTDEATPQGFNQTTGANADAGWVIALGDSYISGEGASDFFRGTNTPESNDCRRAPTAYPQLVGRALDRPVMSFACSGAVTADLLTVSQEPASPDGVFGAEPQLQAFEQWLIDNPDADVDLVLLSIGGNDSGFGDVIGACLTPGANCAEVERAFLDRVGGLAASLDDVHTELGRILDDQLGDDLPDVLVSPYPDPVGDEGVGCNLLIGDGEDDFIRRFRDTLNAEVTLAAARHGAVVSGVQLATLGHELCADEPFLNWLRLSPTDGAWLHSINPGNWINGSLHPNEGGHCVAALLVMQTWGVDTPPTTLPIEGTDSTCSLPVGDPPVASGTPAELPSLCAGLTGEDCTSAWSSDAVQGSVRALVAAVGLLIGGGMLLAVALTSAPRTGWLPGPLRTIWVIVRKVWIEYDKVARGHRAQVNADRYQTKS